MREMFAALSLLCHLSSKTEGERERERERGGGEKKGKGEKNAAQKKEGKNVQTLAKMPAVKG